MKSEGVRERESEEKRKEFFYKEKEASSSLGFHTSNLSIRRKDENLKFSTPSYLIYESQEAVIVTFKFSDLLRFYQKLTLKWHEFARVLNVSLMLYISN